MPWAGSVVCVDPSAAMLGQLPYDERLRAVQASAEDLACGRALLPHEAYEAVLVKEAIHHVEAADRAAVLHGLSGLLAPGGRLLVVMLPARIDYPLFDAALELFTELQPVPEDVAGAMRQADLSVELTYEEFQLSFDRERYLEMVRSRYLSLLSLFDDEQLADGIAEIRRTHPEQRVEFPDRFAFVVGERT